ncbi:hypothetical protein Nepgr_011927 [Nepenthes gracilis]|uniref:RING-type E3 ubiquitin transferase n=1 Tax=Nepenthes gracilis TaxID=150966 RepID=A0AAD3SG12_NEPGR|nr:hypothetical protein Nepgr_011927 [Nepenthes gracilis]
MARQRNSPLIRFGALTPSKVRFFWKSFIVVISGAILNLDIGLSFASAYVVMGHQHVFSTSQIFEGENDQHWTHMQAEDPYHNHLAARPTATESGSLFHPRDNMSIDRLRYVSYWNPPARLNGHSSSIDVTIPHNQTNTSAPCDSLHSVASRNVFMVPENHVQHASSSNYVVENTFLDLGAGNGQPSYKRKSPGLSAIHDQGSSSGYFSAGSSSSASSSDLRLERPNWEPVSLTSTYRGSHLSSRGEYSTRNVRRRSAFELETDVFGAHMSQNYPHATNVARHPIDHSISIDHQSQDLSVPLPDWNHAVLPIAPHARAVVPDASSMMTIEATHFFNGSGVANVSGQMDGYHNDLISGRNPGIPQSPAAISGQTGYVHGSNPTARVSVGGLRLGRVAPSDEGLPFVADSYSSRNPRRIGSAGWRSGDRSGRSRLSAERYRSLSVGAVGHEQLTPEDMIIAEHPSSYGSRNLFDHHRDMRLDIDNMSYEELLALGERIGSVSTGLSEDLLSKCLMATIYCSLDQMQDEERCIICLEEYQNMDEVGRLKSCGHEYHVCCIKKWLSLKNLCPICKVPALAEKTMEN